MRHNLQDIVWRIPGAALLGDDARRVIFIPLDGDAGIQMGADGIVRRSPGDQKLGEVNVALASWAAARDLAELAGGAS